jgi:amidophosphoribosyltransferase
MPKLQEKCGVFGAVTTDNSAARLTYYGLWALQHRGQEGSGIASWGGRQLHRRAGGGLVAHVYHETDLDHLPGKTAIGHNRYATSGAAGGAHAQPVVDAELGFALAHNGNLPQMDALEEFLGGRGVNTGEMNDSEMMGAAIAHYLRQGRELEDAVAEAWPLFTGAFACVALHRGRLVAFRDECGIRPLAIGHLDGSMAVASETCAFDTVGARFLREVKPGELVSISTSGVTSRQVRPARPAFDVFEFVYFARPDSLILNRRVNEVRREMGRQLAREYKIAADIVIPVPDSAIPMALGYAQDAGIPSDHGFIKNRYIHRTFIRPSQAMRERDVRIKLNPVPEVISGRDVIVIDDSIVRGTTTGQIVDMLRDAGARRVHVLVSSPPVRYPDFYGINTPRQEDLVAARLKLDEIREHIHADSLGYLSLDGMVRATGVPAGKLSMSAFTGEYPIDIGNRVTELTRFTS